MPASLAPIGRFMPVQCIGAAGAVGEFRFSFHAVPSLTSGQFSAVSCTPENASITWILTLLV